MTASAIGQGRIGRRALIKGGIALGTGLVVGFHLGPAGRRAARAQAGALAPNQWVSIDRDGADRKSVV